MYFLLELFHVLAPGVVDALRELIVQRRQVLLFPVCYLDLAEQFLALKRLVLHVFLELYLYFYLVPIILARQFG